MHPQLARAYIAVLADALAHEQQMATVTDQPEALGFVAGGWSAQNLAKVLLEDRDDDDVDPSALVAQFAMIAVRTVVPRDIDSVPVGRIIEARRRLLPELLRYRAYLESLSEFFAELATVSAPEVRETRMRLKVEAEVIPRVERLEIELRRAGLRPMQAVLSMKTLAPPAVVAAIAEVASVPTVVTASGMVAGCLLGASAEAARERTALRDAEPLNYLLSLRRNLAPPDVVAAARQVLRTRRSRW